MAEKRPSDSLNRITLEHEEVLLDHAQLGNLSVNPKLSHFYHLPLLSNLI